MVCVCDDREIRSVREGTHYLVAIPTVDQYNNKSTTTGADYSVEEMTWAQVLSWSPEVALALLPVSMALFPLHLQARTQGGGRFPVARKPPKSSKRATFWAILGSARDRSDKNEKLHQIVTQSNLDPIQISKSTRKLSAVGREGLRAMVLEIHHS